MTTLPTFAEFALASPLALRDGASSLNASVGLGQLSGRTLLHLRGAEAETALQVHDMKIGDVAAVEDGLLARLRRDEFVLLARDGRSAFDQLAAMIAGRRVTLTDLTHGRCGLLLVGRDAPRVLPKVCALDFRQFPDLHAAQASLAKVRTLIMRADLDALPAYGLIVDRSLAAYVWDVVFDAAREFGAAALNDDGIDSLRKATLW